MNPDQLRALIDLIVIVLMIVTVMVLLRKGWLQSDWWLSERGCRGGSLAIVGVCIILFTGLFHLGWPLFRPASVEVQGGLAARNGVPLWLHWLLFRIAFVLIASGILMTIIQRRKLEAEMRSSSRQIKAVEYGILQSEERFHRMIETTSESVFCFEFDPPLPVTLPVAVQVGRSHDAVLVECNHAFAKEIGAKQPADVIGLKMGSLDINSDAKAHYRLFESFIENDYHLSGYEMIYTAPDGQDHAYRVSLTGFGSGGHLDKIWGAGHSIQNLRQTESALLARQRCLELLADVSSRLVKVTNDKADIEIRACLKDVCLFLGADRITLFWMDWDKDIGTALYCWNKAEITQSQPDSIRNFPSLSKNLLNGDALRIDDIGEMPGEAKNERKLLAAIGLKSAVIVPLIVAGETVGAMSVGLMRSERQWFDRDVVDLRVFAELFANFVLRQKSYQALDDALTGLQRATDRLEAENVFLRQEIGSTHGFDEIIGQSGALLQCLQAVEKVAETKTPVLILGETGTGKELIARAIHERSDRNDRMLVKVNCAALPGSLIESELFGYRKGAFTGAHANKQGRFDLAHKGTLFLDEIGDIPIDLQAKLLRVLQEGEFERLGGTETIKVDVRLIVATNRNLAKAVDSGEFRSDLYYRINTFPITLPALRDRGNDIQALAEHFVKEHSQRLYREVNAISSAMMEQLNYYSWPGNVRELEGVIQRALISGSGPVLELAEPLFGRSRSEIGEPTIISSTIADLRVVEREHILAVLEEAAWIISGESGAAAKLGVPPSTLRSKMKKLSITRPC